MLFHGYIHVTWLLSCQISDSKNTFFNSRPKYSRAKPVRLLSVFKPLQVSQAAQAGSTVACLDRASIRCKLSKRPLFFSWLVMPYLTHLPLNCTARADPGPTFSLCRAGVQEGETFQTVPE